MAGIEFDMSEVRELVADMSASDGSLNRHVRASVVKGAVNIKNALITDMQASRHFKGAAGDIDFDIEDGGGEISAEIGPHSGPGNPGALANIAYFGTSRGGGTVRNPEYALADELPKFEKAMGDLLEDLL